MKDTIVIDELGSLTSIVGRWWEDPTMTGLNRLRSHALPLRTDQDPLGHDSSLARSLNGAWDFKLLPRPDAAHAGWTTEKTTPDGGWMPISVPGSWTRQGTGDLPHYTNIVMPFSGNPPEVPEQNPTGLYRCSFDQAQGWNANSTILRIGGAESTAAVWLNGHFVGITTDSRLPTEFDLSDHIKPAGNDLAIMVIRWSAETWVEDQDHWHHAGLFRDVCLLSKEPVHINDVGVSASYDHSSENDGSSGQGELVVNVLVEGPSTGWSVTTTLRNRTDQSAIDGGAGSAEVPQFDTSSHQASIIDAYGYRGPRVRTTCGLENIRPWTAEDPYLYDVVIQLVDTAGVVRDEVVVTTGFRTVEIDGDRLLVNGQAIRIAGVNRHDHHPVHGKYMTASELWDDVRTIKAYGFNAVRTSHYPPDQVLLDACDEIGLWVICEANLESHARWQEVSRDQRYELVFIERVQRMVRFHRNHASIIGWSLGNESGQGASHNAAAAWVRAFDPSRFVQYESGVLFRWSEGIEPSAEQLVRRVDSTDIECPMYPSIPAIESWFERSKDRKPLILCEYSHSMGNSNGGLRDYWELVDRYEGFQGGFIWDWRDQGLIELDEKGDSYYVYGGAFGEEPHDAAYCCNGIAGPDGVGHPGIEEHRWLTQPVSTEVSFGSEGLELMVHSRRSFRDLADLELRVAIEVEGERCWEQLVDCPTVGPEEKVAVVVPIQYNKTIGGRSGVVTATVRWSLRDDVNWGPRGHQIAWDQAVRSHQEVRALQLAAESVDSDLPKDAAEDRVSVATVVRIDDEFVLANDRLVARFDDQSGQMTRLESTICSHRGAGSILSPPVLSLWRAPTDNDGVTIGPLAIGVDAVQKWLVWGLDGMALQESSVVEFREGSSVGIRATHKWSSRTGHLVTHTQVFSLNADEPLKVTEEVDIPGELNDLPRVGIRLELSGDCEELTWMGPGPWETYSDRCAAPVGKWSSTVTDEYVSYVRPQHHGSHVDTSWMQLSNDQGCGLRIELDGLTFDASRFGESQLSTVQSTNLLQREDVIHLHIDGSLRGVGAGAVGPDTHDIIAGGLHEFEWAISPACGC